MSSSIIYRSPLDDARRRSLDYSDVNNVFQYGDRSARGVFIGNDTSNDPRLFRKNNLFSRDNISESWNRHKNRTVPSAIQSRTSVLNYVANKTEDQALSKKYAQRKIGRVSPFVTPREEDEYEQIKEEDNKVKILSEELKQQAYLVMDISDQARRPFKRKICTPFNKRITMPPENFKVGRLYTYNW